MLTPVPHVWGDTPFPSLGRRVCLLAAAAPPWLQTCPEAAGTPAGRHLPPRSAALLQGGQASVLCRQEGTASASLARGGCLEGAGPVSGTD